MLITEECPGMTAVKGEEGLVEPCGMSASCTAPQLSRQEDHPQRYGVPVIDANQDVT